MPVFPSEEWMAEFCQRLADHPEAGDIATALDGVYRFIVDPAGPLEQREVYDVEVRPDGSGAAAGVVDDGADPRLTLTTDYRRWQQLVRGELDVGMALMLRRLKVSGDLTRLIGKVNSAGPLLEALGAVDTVWLEEQ